MAFGAAVRMAGPKLLKFLAGGLGKKELALRLAPDALGGLMVGAMTPGDLSDKLIAGVTDAGFGAVGGLAAGGLARKAKAGEVVQFLADMGGSYGGAFGGMAVGDALQRGKDKAFGGEGKTGYERASEEQQALMAEQMRSSILAELGLIPGASRPIYQGQNSYLDMLGMGG